MTSQYSVDAAVSPTTAKLHTDEKQNSDRSATQYVLPFSKRLKHVPLTSLGSSGDRNIKLGKSRSPLFWDVVRRHWVNNARPFEITTQKTRDLTCTAAKARESQVQKRQAKVNWRILHQKENRFFLYPFGYVTVCTKQEHSYLPPRNNVMKW